MSESEKIKQLENEVEILKGFILNIDRLEKGLYFIALKHNWNADAPSKIIEIMNRFNYQRQGCTHKDIDASLSKVINSADIPEVIGHFYACNLNLRALAMYLYTYFNDGSPKPFQYGYREMYENLMERAKNPSTNPFDLAYYPPNYCLNRYYYKEKPKLQQ